MPTTQIPPRHIRSADAMLTASDRYYACGAVNAAAPGTIVLSTALLYAMPFTFPRNGTLDRIAVNVTAAVAASNVIFGLYSNTMASGELNPGSLLADSGVQSSAATGVRSATINLEVFADTVYWALLSASGAITTRSLAVGGTDILLGLSNALGSSFTTHRTASRTYDGTLPTPAPTGTSFATGTCPTVFYRWQS